MALFPEKTAIAQKSVEDLFALIQEAVDVLGTEFTENDNFWGLFVKLEREGKVDRCGNLGKKPLESEAERFVQKILRLGETVCKNIEQSGRRALNSGQTMDQAMKIIRKETHWRKQVEIGVMRKRDQLLRSCRERTEYFEVYLRIPAPKKLTTTFEQMQLIEAREKAKIFKKARKQRKKPPETGPRNRFRL